MKIKTSDLTDAALDWAVAKCNGQSLGPRGFVVYYEDGEPASWQPSTNWAQGGPIIEREAINLNQWQGAWVAELDFLPDDDSNYRYGKGVGPTPLIAAMRCYVASKLGAEVEIPKELT